MSMSASPFEAVLIYVLVKRYLDHSHVLEITINSLDRNSELNFFLFNSTLKNKKRKSLVHHLNWKISDFTASVGLKVFGRRSFQLGNRVTSDDSV